MNGCSFSGYSKRYTILLLILLCKRRASLVYTLYYRYVLPLTLSWRRSLSYRNQSIDLQGKSMNWFLYDKDLRHERVELLEHLLSIKKILPSHDANYSLTRWLPTTSILVVMGRIYRYQFKCNYLKKQSYFLDFFFFFCIIGIYIKFWTFWKKRRKMSLIVQVFLKLLTPKRRAYVMRKRSCYWKLLGSERVNESQKLLKSAENYFYPTFSLFWAN